MAMCSMRIPTFSLLVLFALWSCTSPDDGETIQLPVPEPDSVEVESEPSGVVGDTSEFSSAPWNDARSRGVDFRALGNEPGWIAEIYEGDSLSVIADYGERTATTPYPEPRITDETTTYHAVTEANTLTIVIEEGPCFDGMSGQEFEHTVRMTLNGVSYDGCGNWLQ